MGFFDRLANLFSGGASKERMLPIYVYSRRCREAVAGTVDRMSELSQPDESDHSFYVRKVLHTSGRNRCFDQVEVQIWFDKNKQVAQHEVQGGDWLTEEEYLKEVEKSK